MAKIRIHELAKKLGIPKAQLLAQLTDAGVAADSYASTVDEDEATRALAAPAPPKVEPPKP